MKSSNKQINDSVIKYIPTMDLIAYINNSRTHSPEQISQIAASIREFGFTNPVLTDGDNGIIAGHGRVMAAQKLELEFVPCIELPYLTEAQRKAYIIADNKLALNAGWDDDVLKAEIEQLREFDFNIDVVGFNADELNLLFNGWNPDIDVRGSHGEHTDGIGALIKVSVSQEEAEFAREQITNALDAAGISYEL